MIASHLASTLALIQRAFPSGLTDHEYGQLLVALYTHCSDRALADVLSEATGRDRALVYNDVLWAGSLGDDLQRSYLSDDFMERMRAVGFDGWAAEGCAIRTASVLCHFA